jgi:hypothetical protein
MAMFDPWAEQPLKSRLVKYLGPVTRANVLADIRSEIPCGVIVELEMPDGMSLLRVMGKLVAAAPGPQENPEEFAIVATQKEELAWTNPKLASFLDSVHQVATGEQPVPPHLPMVRWLRLPDTEIDEYVGGWRFHLGGGVKLAVVVRFMPKPEGWQPEEEPYG